MRSSFPPPSARPIWVDGALVAPTDARVSVLAHSLQRGSLVFDVGALRETKSGALVCFRARDHVDWFLRSATLVGLDVRWDRQALLAATVRTAREGGVRRGVVRWSAFVATLEADVVPRPTARASVAIAVIAPNDAAGRGEPALPPKPETVNVAIPRDTRKAGPEVFPPHAKVAASYLGPMLAKRRALSYGYDEVVLLDREGRVAEAPTANVFVVRDGRLLTPPTERVLPGVTRASLLEIARAEGIPASETHLAPEELEDADEAFLCSTSAAVLPIASVDGKAMRGGAPGSLTARLRELFLACESGADPRFAHWVDPVD